jgi:AraC-like DNA-binding protein
MSGGTSSRIPSTPHGLVRKVGEIVTTSCPERYPNIQLVAGALGMSTRTLQRRLGDEGVTYAQVVAEARADTARRMLHESTRKIGEIARTIGYSNAAHFTRAFLRWTGRTPRDFRRLRKGADGVRGTEATPNVSAHGRSRNRRVDETVR